jgi:hypothetical protein
MLTFTVEELIRFLSNWTMTFFEGAKRSGDIVFSRYYSFFKHPVLVREHQVESLYVMVQNRDSSDNKKPSFSRFAKWEFGGFIVDSKTIYMASKPVKALLQSSDFIDDMDVFEKLDSIRIPLFRKNIPADPAMFQDIQSLIVSKDEATVNRIADMLDSMGFDAVTGYFDPKEDERSGEVDSLTGYYYVDI